MDKAGRATGDLSQTTKSTDLGKSVLGAGSKLANDPLGTIMNPGKLLEDRADTQGTAIADPEIMSVCYAALDKGKWNGKVGGHKHSEWVATGEKIRAACTVRGTGRMAEIVSVDKGAVQRAMAEWTKSDSADRKEALDAIIRPLGGIPGGKAYAFPDGTETMQADWNALVVADPLQGARDKVAAKQPEAALAEMQAVKGKVASLHARLKTASDKFKGMDIQHAEMLGHVNTRMNEINAAIRDLAKTMPAAPAAGATPSVSTVPTLEQVKEEEGRQRAQDAKADLEVYNNNIETMKGYSESVFKKLGQAEARMKDNGLFSDSAIARTVDAARWVKEAEDLLKIWDALYWPTFQLYQKWSPFLALDKARVERLHPAGARGRWQQVYDMTRDKSMAGR